MAIEIRPLAEKDLQEADRIFRLAFGTFIGLPDPMAFAGDADLVASRWRAGHTASFGAFDGGVLIGSNLATRWGSFAFFGPLTIRPDYWNKGVAQQLLAPTMAAFDRWGVRQRALFTFATSPKHHALYGKFGFAKQALTPLLTKAVAGASAGGWSAFTRLAPTERAKALADVRALTDAVFPGLDLTGEIAALEQQSLGEVVLTYDAGALAGVAVCHAGAGTEAGSATVYVKFAAVRPGAGAGKRFERLVAGIEDFARSRGLAKVNTGVNAAREDALAVMKARGYETMMEGIAMQSPDSPGFSRPDCYVLDDWR